MFEMRCLRYGFVFAGREISLGEGDYPVAAACCLGTAANPEAP